VICVLGFGVLALEGARIDPSHKAELLFFLALVAVTSTWRVHLAGKLGTLSVGFAIVYAMLLILGMSEAVLGGAVGALTGTLRSTRTGKFQPLHRILFGIASLSLTAWIAGHIYLALGGAKTIDPRQLLTPVSASTAVYFFVNTLLVAVPVALSRRESISQTWRGLFLWTAPSYYAGTFCAVLMSIFYHRLGFAAMVFIIPPLYIVLYSYRLYIEKMQQEMKHIAALKESSERLSELYLSTVHSLVAAIDAKDRYTRHHSSRVQQYAIIIGEQMELSKDSMEAIRTGGLLHDVGKLGVPDFILSKPASLTPDEVRRVQEHPVLGYEILKPLPFPWDVLPVVRSHHERYDGKGYPDGLAGEEIPQVARVLAVADVYDAVTSERPYRKAWSHEKAVAYIRDAAGTQFDPQVVEAFLQVQERVRQVKQNVPIGESNTTASSNGNTTTNGEKGLRVHALEHITNAHQEVFALYEITQVMGSTLSLDETIHLILQKLQHIVGSSCCVLFLIDKHKNELSAHDAVGPYAETVRLMRLPIGEGVTGQVVQQRQSMLSENAAQDFKNMGAEKCPPFQSLVSAPLVHKGEMLGALTCYHEQPKAFTRDVVQLLPVFANYASLALHNSLTLEHTRQSALTDSLTGLPNSRYLFMCLEQEIERSLRNHQPLSLLVIDLNDFKLINDTYGHLAGDQMLKEFGCLLRELGRSYDTVVRYAGDEYFVLLPNTDAHDAQTWSVRLYEAVRHYNWMIRPGHPIRITASVGAATFPLEAKDVQDLIQLADERMYAVKSMKKDGLAVAV
jgi:diguanylate cyclase (GGDEF)-like protein/putative nucleotidyltransferase with HDIG domain